MGQRQGNQCIGDATNESANGTSANEAMFGADTLFVFSPASGLDAFRDFTASARLLLSGFAFGGGLTTAAPVTLVQGSTPVAAPGSTGGPFPFDTGDGRLHSDVDGAGAAAAVWLATLLNGGVPAGLTASRIVVA